MTVANVSRNRLRGLPKELQVAQESIELPEVQEMLRKLSKYNLGIYMPHMHDDQTGAFRPLPSGITQVEDGLRVSFQPEEECTDQPDLSYMPVGWYCYPGTVSASDPQKCVMRCSARCTMQGTMHTSGHDSHHGTL